MGRCPHVVTNYVCKYGSEFKELSHNSDELSDMFTDLGYSTDASDDLWEFPSDSFKETLEYLRRKDEAFFNSYGVHKEQVIRLMETVIAEDQTGDGFVRICWY